MLRKQLLVLDPAVHTPETDTFNLIAQQSSLYSSYHLIALQGFGSIEKCDPRSIKGVVLLGSSSSVYENKDWQKTLIQYMETWISNSIPILGLCYGHQLIAHIFGTKVYNEGKKFVGFRRIKSLAEHKLNWPSSQGFVFAAHQEKLQDLPNGFNLCAHGDDNPIDAMVHQDLPIWSWQAHIEATPIFCQNQGFTSISNHKIFAWGNQYLFKFLDYLKS